jgi:ABC-2 type transport system ATP-binding protein
MNIEVHQISKKFGNQWAVKDLSFSIVKKGIVGLLGTNGAGKSTTMKMLTGVINPSGGFVKITGLDVGSHMDDLKYRIGYLPESNPLYTDMYVQEFLGFIAAAYKLKNKKQAINKVIEECGLKKEKNKLIKNLSKGYKQRVGLAQAIIHDPELLVLDEPTSGLDSNQLIEIRDLIKNLSQNKTIVFSSHIMQEVEALCDRVIIIDQGKLIADDSILDLQAKLNNDTILEIEFENEPKNKISYRLNQEDLSLDWNGKILSIRSKIKSDIRPDIFYNAVKHNDVIIRFEQSKQTFESVFQNLTNKS